MSLLVLLEYMLISWRPVRDTDVRDRVNMVCSSIAWSMSVDVGDILVAL